MTRGHVSMPQLKAQIPIFVSLRYMPKCLSAEKGTNPDCW